VNLTDITDHGDSPMITIPGLGQMTLAQAKRGVQSIIEDMAADIKYNHWKELKYRLDHGILQVYINAIAEAQSKQH
jgi:acyl-CoA-binding protein